jgi:hypothetical protein
MSLLLEPDTTRDELIEALANLNRVAKRIPSHYVDAKAKAHADIDDLLTILVGMS